MQPSDHLRFVDTRAPELRSRDAALDEQRATRVVAFLEPHCAASAPELERVGLVVGLCVRRCVQLEHDLAGRDHERVRRVDRLLERERPLIRAVDDELRKRGEPLGLVASRCRRAHAGCAHRAA